MHIESCGQLDMNVGGRVTCSTFFVTGIDGGGGGLC